VTDGPTHYDVLGIEPHATKEEIRAAYQERLNDAQAAQAREHASKRPSESALSDARAEEAEARAAWQVLSDPYQRGRYDASIDAPEDPDRDVVEGEIVDDDDSGSQNGAGGARGTRTRPARGERPPGMFSTERPKTPESWPPGFHPPPPRARFLAMMIDVAVLAVILLVSQLAISPLVIDQMYPKESKQLDHAQTCLDRLSTADDALGTGKESARIDSANAACAEFPKAYGSPLNADESKKQLSKRIENKTSDVEDRQTEIQQDIAPGTFAVSLGGLIVMLLVLVPSSLRTGRTLGKHLMQIRVVQIDGSPLTLRPAIARYATPLLFAQFLGALLGPLSYAFALFGVLTWPRNPNLQGLHDRLARTIVVDG
jgi:curved DNA-binding protein CbpA